MGKGGAASAGYGWVLYGEAEAGLMAGRVGFWVLKIPRCFGDRGILFLYVWGGEFNLRVGF